MTYRERRQRKIERLQEWADKREEKAENSFDRASALTEHIPFGQPILMGHHSEHNHRRTLERSDHAMARGFEHQQQAADMRQRAATIAGQLDRSIYSDDPDAIEQLEARIADLVAQGERIKAYNASCRKGQPDPTLLDEKQRRDIAGTIRVGMAGDKGQFPGYALSNLNGNINRNKKRLAALKRRQEAA